MVEVRISDLAHEFEDRTVFQSLNFAFDGDCLAVTGPNGSGKSTLLRILAGLLTPTGGRASFVINGDEVSRESLRGVVGLAAPDVRLYSELTPRENLTFLARARLCQADVEAALNEAGLLARADDPVAELSSGLKQRAALAAALLHRPLVLMLDEPSSNLDESGREMVRRVIDSRRSEGMVILATNDPDEALLGAARLDLGAAG